MFRSFSIYIAPLISSSSWDVRFDLLLLLLLLMLIDPRLAKSRSSGFYAYITVFEYRKNVKLGRPWR